jgi:hypothetical protein
MKYSDEGGGPRKPKSIRNDWVENGTMQAALAGSDAVEAGGWACMECGRANRKQDARCVQVTAPCRPLPTSACVCARPVTHSPLSVALGAAVPRAPARGADAGAGREARGAHGGVQRAPADRVHLLHSRGTGRQ